MVVSQNLWSLQQMSGTSQPYKKQLLLWSYSERHTTPGSHAMSPTHQLTQWDLHKDSHWLTHPQSHQLLHYRHMGPLPTAGLTVGTIHTHTHTVVPWIKNPLPKKWGRNGVQAEYGTDCTDQVQSIAGENTDQCCLHITHTFYPFIPLFYHICFSPKPPLSLPFPILDSSFKHPLVNLMLLRNTLCLLLIRCS